MTAQALRAAAVAPRASARRFGRAPLAMKLAIAFLGLVALVLIVNGAIDTYLTYNQAKRAALEVESEKARGAAERVGGFLSDIQTELGWTAGIEWGFGKPEQQRYDFIRLLRQAPAITALSYIDGHGKEQLAVSRLEPDAIASGKDFSADPRFQRAVADKVWFGPVEFRRGSEPYMTIAVAHVGKTPGVTVADVNLKLIWDVVGEIHVGKKGFAYVVDDRGRLIAHPDLSLVLRDSDLSQLPQVEAALAREGAPEAAGPQIGTAEAARSLNGAAVLTAYAITPKTRWAVFVEQPLAEALATAYGTLARALSLLGLGLVLAAVSGVALARRMAAPIRVLQAGVERLGAGDLAQRLDIRTGDEIEALAGGFNRMAEKLQESHENLEAKVEARTRDLAESLEHQTATSKVLEIIASSPSVTQPVFEAIAASAKSVLRGHTATVLRFIDGFVHIAAFTPVSTGADAALSSDFPQPLGKFDPHANILSGECVEINDTESGFAPTGVRDVGRARGFRSLLQTPLMHRGVAVGLFVVTRETPGLFSPSEIRLARAFADQAVIAIENTRLFSEVQARTRDLEESLARQTATADVLKIISRSIADAAPVFETILESCQRLFDPHGAAIYLIDGDMVEGVAKRGFEGQGHWGADRMPLAGSSTGRAIAERRAVHIRDLAEKPDLSEQAKIVLRDTGGMTVLYAPMLSGERGVGSLVVTRRPRKPFSDTEIDFIQTFADQAVIAIENARLFAEVRAKTRDLEASLAQQTATADVLKVISRSAFDLDAIFHTLVTTAVELCEASSGTLCVRDGDVFRYRGMAGPEATAELQHFLEAHPLLAPNRQTVAGRAILSRRTEQIEDVLGEADYAVPMAAHGSPARSLLGVPLIGKTEVLGAIVVARAEPGAFPTRHVEILRTFADQAVIAIENSRLFEQVQARTRELEQSLSDLRKTQDRLVQSEKLASLGQLTAGIAHEIKNPLNFVNNFASLSRELLDELRETLQRLPNDAKADADDLIGMIGSNLEKVASHGKRADSIVKNMLLHSREGSGERTRVNVNAMVEEALNLGYHGARAEKPDFNVTIEKALDPDTGEADLYLQEVTRVLLNLISNGFYASAKRKQSGGANYEPTLGATTRSLGRSVEIRIRDNGTGIPDDVRAKMFNPFFTTKPAGEGTGLGLSLSHDIVVKQHGGTLDVETAPGAFTEFIITLPRGGAGT